jgi:beta-glucanase (GH16 family)
MKRLSTKEKLLRKLKSQQKRFFRLVKKRYKKYIKLFKTHRPSLKTIAPLLVLIFLICFILCLQIIIFYLPNKTDATKLGVSTQSRVKSSSSGVRQDNSLFTTYPSWSQDFSSLDNRINPKYWNVSSGPAQNSNNEAEYYTPANVKVQNGALNIIAQKQPEPDSYNYSSGRLDTQNKVSFLYGRIDVTAKLPNGVGTWPAVWLLPTNNYYENFSPASDPLRYLNGGEIDLAEEVGLQPSLNYGIIHTLNASVTRNGIGLYNTIYLANNNTTYYTYSMLWTPTSITFEVNNQPYFTYTRIAGSSYATWPFDQPFYLIMNLAIGGSWGGEDTLQFPGNGIDNSIFPTSMSIKSIYYYPYVGR